VPRGASGCRSLRWRVIVVQGFFVSVCSLSV
jgi:hypothetical protein